MLPEAMAGNPFRLPAGDLMELARRIGATATKQTLGVAHARALLGELPERARNPHERIALTAARAYHALTSLRGQSPAMQRVRRETWAACFGDTLAHALHLEQVIHDHDVLIIGETGTGKEGIAIAIQDATPGGPDGGPAPRAAINAAAIP